MVCLVLSGALASIALSKVGPSLLLPVTLLVTVFINSNLSVNVLCRMATAQMAAVLVAHLIAQMVVNTWTHCQHLF